jgi:SAM-dependent methyltransferase
MPVRRWTDLGSNPNTPEARDFRRRTIAQAWRPPVESRMEYLTQLAAGKRVLDIGVVGHSPDFYEDGQWMHEAIVRVAKSCLGVDVIPDEIAKLQARGFNVMLRDVTAEPLEEQFEVIICGEVIEHLGNPAGLFKAAMKMLERGGRLVITTPNPYSDSNIRLAIQGKFEESVDHVTLLVPSGIAEFAEREGLVLESYRGVSGRRLKKFRNRLRYQWALKRYGGPATDRFCRRLMYECVRPADRAGT